MLSSPPRRNGMDPMQEITEVELLHVLDRVDRQEGRALVFDNWVHLRAAQSAGLVRPEEFAGERWRLTDIGRDKMHALKYKQ
jgi:hypothetical protein